MPTWPSPTWAASSANPERPVGAGPADAQVVVDHPHRAARPTQPLGPRDQVVLAGGGLPVAVDLRQRGLADVDHRRPPQMRGGHLELTHQRSPPSRSARRPWRSRRPAARSPPRPPRSGNALGRHRRRRTRWRRGRVGHQTELDRLHGSPPCTVTSAQPVPAPALRRSARSATRSHACNRSDSDPSVDIDARRVRSRRISVGPRRRDQRLAAIGQHQQQLQRPRACAYRPAPRSDLPSNGCRDRVIVTADGKSSTRVVRRGFVRPDRPRSASGSPGTVPRQGTHRQVVGGRGDRGRRVRPDRGGHPAGRGR